jgi:hypothetical protein
MLRGHCMLGNMATIVGGVVSSVAFFAHRVIAFAQAPGDGEIGPNLTTGLGVGGLVVALTGLAREFFRHRETMQESELADRVTELEARMVRANNEFARAAAERDNLKTLLSVMYPVLQHNRGIIYRANALHPDEFPLPENFGDREFDHQIGTLFGPGSLMATVKPSREVRDVIENRRSMPTPDPNRVNRRRIGGGEAGDGKDADAGGTDPR